MQFDRLKRREFISLLGGAAAWPVTAHAQQAAMPVVGFINPASPGGSYPPLPAFLKGLGETGFVEGRNVVIEYRWAEGHYATIAQQGVHALLVGIDPFLTAQRNQIVALAARHAIPAVYPLRDFAVAGGLMSYGTDFADAYHQGGIYTGRILRGEKPADLPVQRSTKFEFVINFKTAKTLGIEVPNSMQLLATEVIE